MFLMENSVLLQHFSYRLASCVPKYEFGLKCFCWSTRYCCNVSVIAEHPVYPSMTLVSNVFVGALGIAATFQLSLSGSSKHNPLPRFSLLRHFLFVPLCKFLRRKPSTVIRKSLSSKHFKNQTKSFNCAPSSGAKECAN